MGTSLGSEVVLWEDTKHSGRIRLPVKPDPKLWVSSIGFARSGKLKLYTHPHRITGMLPPLG